MSAPKTLRIVDGKPILIRILDAVRTLDPRPVIIVSPDGRAAIESVLHQAGYSAELIEQAEALGMGHAVLQFERAAGFARTETVVTVWGDMLAVDAEVIRRSVEALVRDRLDLAFPTHIARPPYTLVVRDEQRQVVRVVERRETPQGFPEESESDVGIFVFRREPIFEILRSEFSQLRGSTTGEVGFLSVIGFLAARGRLVAALPIATAYDASTFNTPEDLALYQRLRRSVSVKSQT
jgi:bifunctional UDP-N-acetylglucosamine pyrophosphorylase/glucosamine-1-phosphate N-acetyltransferase